VTVLGVVGFAGEQVYVDAATMFAGTREQLKAAASATLSVTVAPSGLAAVLMAGSVLRMRNVSSI
jgi:hypothetical protein